MGFSSLLLCSKNPCKPFDKNRDGLNLGEGSGILLMEKANDKRQYSSFLRSYSNKSDCYHPTTPHPQVAGLSNAIDVSLSIAKLKAQDIGFINSHGTATLNNDKIEGKILYEKFADIPLFAGKSYTGHTLGASGALEAIFSIQSLLDQKLPRTLGFSNYDEDCQVRPTTHNISIDARYAISTSLAFGGNNSVIILEKGEI